MYSQTMSLQQLYQLLLEHPEKGFQILVERYQKPLLSYITYKSFYRENVEDVFQETMYRAYKYIPALKNPDKMYAWLCGIALNVLREYGRSRHPHLPLLEERCETSVQPESMENISCFISQLPELYQQVVVLKYLDGYSYSEISDLLHIHISTVRSRLFEARKILRNKIEGDQS